MFLSYSLPTFRRKRVRQLHDPAFHATRSVILAPEVFRLCCTGPHQTVAPSLTLDMPYRFDASVREMRFSTDSVEGNESWPYFDRTGQHLRQRSFIGNVGNHAFFRWFHRMMRLIASRKSIKRPVCCEFVRHQGGSQGSSFDLSHKIVSAHLV